MQRGSLGNSRVKVKHEPPVEFVLILPRPSTSSWKAIKQEKDVKPKRIPSVKLEKFDAKWKSELKLFQSFFACPHCRLVVKSLSNLNQHQKTCGKIKSARFGCDFCGRGFQLKYLIRRHMTKHSSERKFCCLNWGFGFKCESSLRSHSKAKTIRQCAACDVKFSCKLLLDRHQNDFHENAFNCDECPYQIKTKSSLTAHKGTHEKLIECETCQKKFSINKHLKLHQMQHKHGIYATAPDETFGCNKCGKFFSSSNYLRDHQRNVHDENEVKCDVCNKICKNRILLRQHSQTHVKKVECSVCHKMVAKYFMAAHLRSHSTEKSFECDFCNYSAKTKASLKEHIERIHLLRQLVDDSKFRNDFEDFELLDKLQLKYGSSATTSEKNFECGKCGKSYVTPKTLKQHKKQVHSEKTFECEICKKVFKNKGKLNEHKANVHLKVACSVCGRKVGQSRLKSHMKLHQPGNHFECDLCAFKAVWKKWLEIHINRKHRSLL